MVFKTYGEFLKVGIFLQKKWQYLFMIFIWILHYASNVLSKTP